MRHREWSPGTVILLHCTQKGAVLAIVGVALLALKSITQHLSILIVSHLDQTQFESAIILVIKGLQSFFT
ncbi:hypothetical protein DLM_2817 [Aquitalea magnusonii]|uniref:Uncharacterized protein n=1 Tax=Aquitalea magnusonii TaxID=332411 RepID=A0A3G9GEZ1_9NEIS|nr:hypothetical protein DLM_2817 [Aquitalea magnusonii]